MKRVIAVFFMLSLSACAGMYGKDAKPSNNKLVSNQYDSGLDENYMARVQRQADHAGIVVKWVHPPRAPKPKKDG
jgi:hypothetical protein